MYTFTVADLRYMFDMYNAKYFNSALASVRIYIDHTRNRLGCFHHRDRSISISDYLVRSEHDIAQTLVHEMIHLWQYQMFHTADHGVTFKKKAQEIKALSGGEFNITRCSSTAGATVRNAKEERVELLLFDWKGKTWCCRPCNGKGRYLIARRRGSQVVTGMKLISAYGDFGRWARCSTRLRPEMEIKDINEFYNTYKVKDIK